jgi:signal transduction histidine kinase
MDDRIQKEGRTIKTSLPSYEVYVNGDGKRLYRVLQNLIDNALKYSMEGTRIHLRLFVRDWQAMVEILNVAGYEMDFTEAEIRERFVRGDKSRSTEGSGLGLSIAESFTQLCGGSLDISIEGDSFKVTLRFPLSIEDQSQ